MKSDLSIYRPKPRNPFPPFLRRIRMEYYRYEVTFGLYVMTSGEKVVVNALVIVFMSLLLWGLLQYFPSLLYRKVIGMLWLLTGHSDQKVGMVVLDKSNLTNVYL